MKFIDPTFEELVVVHNLKEAHVHQNLYEFCGWLNIVKKIEPKVYLEIGSYKLGSAQLAVELLPSLKLFVTIDIHDLTKQLREFDKLQQYKGRINFIHGNSGSFDCLSQVSNILGKNIVDVLFIDGDHTLNGVMRDYAMYGLFMEKGGLIGIHDCRMKNMPDDNIPVDAVAFWQLLSQKYPQKCKIVDAEPGPWGNYGIGIYCV